MEKIIFGKVLKNLINREEKRNLERNLAVNWNVNWIELRKSSKPTNWKSWQSLFFALNPIGKDEK